MLRGLAVAAMVLAHVIDSWTRDADRQATPFFVLYFVGGTASPLFLFLTGLAGALSAAGKARRAGSHRAGAQAVRARGWEIFALGLVFRLQAQLLGMGPLANLLKVDMLNVMGLALVAASGFCQLVPDRRRRMALFAGLTTVVALVTPLVRAAPGLAVLPDPLEAYLRPAGPFAAFSLFPWAGFLFGGFIIGDLIDASRSARRREIWMQGGVTAAALAGVWLAWAASFQPALFPTARFWHDSPTFFFIRLGIATATVPLAWAAARLVPAALAPLAGLGRASLFVYWIHIEMVYGVIAEPVKRGLPLRQTLVATAVLIVGLSAIVRLRNRLVERHGLQGRLRMLAPILR